MSKKKKKNNQEVLEDIYEREPEDKVPAFVRENKSKKKPSLSRVDNTPDSAQDFDELVGEDIENSEAKEMDQFYQPDYRESKTWMFVTIMIISLLIIAALAAGFTIFL